MSEHGFYHPDAGYWQTTSDIPPEIIATYPEGTVEVPLKPRVDYDYDGTAWVKRPVSVEELRVAKLVAVVAKANVLLSSGAPVSGGLHIALDDGSRADLTAMATTATAASTDAIPWPESYSRGWIAIENVRIPLVTPADGLTLAASVGDWYAAVIQHRRDLKDSALAAKDAATLDAIDIAAGWPA